MADVDGSNLHADSQVTKLRVRPLAIKYYNVNY